MTASTFPIVRPQQDPLIVRLLKTMDQLDVDLIEELWQPATIDPRISVSDPSMSLGQSIEMRLIDRGLADEHAIAQAYGKHYLLPVFDPPSDTPPPIDPTVGQLLERTFCEENQLAPLATDGNFIDVAVFRPESLLLSEKIQTQTERHMRPMFAPLSVVQRMLSTLYPGTVEENDSEQPAGAPESTQRSPRLAAVAKRTSDSRPNRYLSDLLNRAIRGGVSAIYFDLLAGVPRIRFRQQDKLVHFDTPSTSELYEAMLGQIKRIAKIDARSSSLAMSGSINLRRDGLCVDAAVHTLRTHDGEQLVIKLHEGVAVPRELSALGLSLAQQREVLTAIRRVHGMMLVVGPARSGRTTTQYACLNQINDINLIRCTIERRVQETIPGAIQLSILDHTHRDGARCFDACHQHDPDVILVESLDDRELAQRAVIAASTQKRILASLRATTAIESIGQLRQLGVDDGLIASSLSSIVSQRRVRRLCEHCREETSLPTGHAQALRVSADRVVHNAKGCDKCHGTGYAGSCILFEVLTISTRLAETISMGASSGEIAKVIRELDASGLAQSALDNVLQGNTTIDEVQRIGLLRF